jgi:hypothetical protein
LGEIVAHFPIISLARAPCYKSRWRNLAGDPQPLGTSSCCRAGVHTLNVWRYLAPAVPMVGIMLSLFAVEMAETTASFRRG